MIPHIVGNLALLFALAFPGGQQAHEATKRVEQPQPSNRASGLWPTPRLMELMLRRWADEVSHQHSLDEAQRRKVSDAVSRRWGSFFAENSSTIEPLFNEFLEMRLGVEPPDKKRMQAWAQRAAPLMNKVRGRVEGAIAEFRDILEPHQRMAFEVKARAFSDRLDDAESWLGRFEKGEFDEADMQKLWRAPGAGRWGPSGRGRGEGEEPDRAPRGSVREESDDDQITAEIRRWRVFVEEFVKTYDLDDGQRTTARSLLTEMQQRAIAHRDTRRGEIAKLEKRIAGFNGADKQLQELRKQLASLYGPIDEMFAELQARIERIPNEAQRAHVEELRSSEVTDTEVTREP